MKVNYPAGLGWENTIFSLVTLNLRGLYTVNRLRVANGGRCGSPSAFF